MPNIFIQTSSEFGDGQDFEHSKIVATFDYDAELASHEERFYRPVHLAFPIAKAQK